MIKCMIWLQHINMLRKLYHLEWYVFYKLEQCNTVSRSRSIDISNVDVVDLLFNISLSIFHSHRDINIVGERLQEFGLCWAPTAGWGRYGTTLTVQWWIQEFTYAVIILKNKPLNNSNRGACNLCPGAGSAFAMTRGLGFCGLPNLVTWQAGGTEDLFSDPHKTNKSDILWNEENCVHL